jgi:hypothetical protein
MEYVVFDADGIESRSSRRGNGTQSALHGEGYSVQGSQCFVGRRDVIERELNSSWRLG